MSVGSRPDDLVVGIDIGGTKTAVVLVDRRNNIIARDAVATPAGEGGEAVVARAVALTRTLLASTPGEIVAVGCGAAGVIDQDTGSIRAASSSFVGWTGYPLAAALQAALGVPAAIVNDVNAFLLGEAAVGAARADDVLGVMLGTGVGGALLLDGTLRSGPHGAAGEIGHTPGFSRHRCTCGQMGHLETIASGRSIAARFQERVGGPGITAVEVADLARAGDVDAIAVFEDAARGLTLACSTVASLLDLELVVVGGSVALSWDLLEPTIAAVLATDSPVSGLPLQIVPSTLGVDAVVIGAAAAGRRAADISPILH